MNRCFLRAAASVLAFTLGIVLGGRVRADVLITMPSPAYLAMQADVVVVGKVTAIEPAIVEAETINARKPELKPVKTGYRIALVSVQEALLGGDLKTIRVGLPAAQPRKEPVEVPDRHSLVESFGSAPTALSVGEEGIFIVDRHPAADFFMFDMRAFWGPEGRSLTWDGCGTFQPVGGQTYAEHLAAIRKVAAAHAAPVKALQSPELADRSLALTALLYRYARRPVGLGQDEKPATQDIPAEVNQWILKVLTEVEVSVRSRCWDFVGATGYVDPNPNEGFKNGYVSARDEAILRYIHENRDKIHIRKNVMSK